MGKCTNDCETSNDVRFRNMGSEEITICGRNEGVEMDELSYQGGQNKQ